MRFWETHLWAWREHTSSACGGALGLGAYTWGGRGDYEDLRPNGKYITDRENIEIDNEKYLKFDSQQTAFFFIDCTPDRQI